jgi:hypothetical protein
MSTDDQTYSARLHGEALVAAERLFDDPAFAAILARLSEASDSPEDRAKVAGQLAGETFAQLGEGGGDLGYRMIAAGLLLTTGVVDYDELGQAVQAGYERGKGSLEGYDPSRWALSHSHRYAQ